MGNGTCMTVVSIPSRVVIWVYSLVFLKYYPTRLLGLAWDGLECWKGTEMTRIRNLPCHPSWLNLEKNNKSSVGLGTEWAWPFETDQSGADGFWGRTIVKNKNNFQGIFPLILLGSVVEPSVCPLLGLFRLDWTGQWGRGRGRKRRLGKQQRASAG